MRRRPHQDASTVRLPAIEPSHHPHEQYAVVEETWQRQQQPVADEGLQQDRMAMSLRLQEESVRLHEREVARMEQEIARQTKELQRKDELLERKDKQLEHIHQEYRDELKRKDEQRKEELQRKDQQLERKDEQLAQSHAQLVAVLQNATTSIVSVGTPETSIPPLTSSRHAPAAPTVARAATLRAPSQVVRMVRPAEPAPEPPNTPMVQSVETIVTRLISGSDDADATVTSFLEYALEVTEAAVLKIPRRQRKQAKALGDCLESMLEESGPCVAVQLASYEAVELAQLGSMIHSVQALSILEADAESVATVEAALAELERCSDVVAVVARQLASVEADVRLHGMRAVQELPRVHLEVAVAAEVELIPILQDMGLDRSRSCVERQSALLGIFAVGVRNVEEAAAALLDLLEPCSAILRELFVRQIDGTEGVGVAAAYMTIVRLCTDFVSKAEPAVRDTHHNKLMRWAALVFKKLPSVWTKQRVEELAPVILHHLADDDDIVVAAGIADLLADLIMFETNQELVAQPPAAILASEQALLGLYRRVAEPHPAWWKARSIVVTVETVCIQNVWNVLCWMAIKFAGHLSDDTLAEAVNIVKINREAELSAQEKAPAYTLFVSFNFIKYIAATAEAKRDALRAATGLVDALMYSVEHSVEHSVEIFGNSLASAAAKILVPLIGHNEGGMTLTRHIVHQVLDEFHWYFTAGDTGNWKIGTYQRKPAKAAAADANVVRSMAIADVNKTFMMQHSTVIDDLVCGLLLEESNPRRAQDGSGKLQEACALVLQNLALSDIGKKPLRSHSQVIPSLRQVATAEGGLSEQARHYASGALFELDEVARQKAKDAAVAAKTAAGRGSDGETGDDTGGHVMLSYNWSHQEVIKRINTALKARCYSVWIDVEKMQGSTVEAMADAVEDAAVMCYGISQAYKESTNCRMEAQYAFQQRKDMVPLKVEKGYNAKGWLGILLGVRLWYGFYGTVLETEALFKGKVDELCRELGERGKA